MTGRGGNKEGNNEQIQGAQGGDSSGIEHITRLKVGPVQYVANHDTNEMTAQVDGQEELVLDTGEVNNLRDFFAEYKGPQA